MPTNRKRRSRKARAQFRPLYMAILTGGPLPEDVGAFEAHNVLNPSEPGLVSVGDLAPPFAEAWRQYHGAPMTDADVAAVRDRASEIRAAVEASRARRHGARPAEESNDGPATSNWPESETDNFQSIAKGELDDETD